MTSPSSPDLGTPSTSVGLDLRLRAFIVALGRHMVPKLNVDLSRTRSTDMADLHIAQLQCESNQLRGPHNIGVIRSFLWDPKRKAQQQLALITIVNPPEAPVKYHSRYTSSLLVHFICDLSKHAPRYMHNRRGRIHMKHDTYTCGTLLDMNIAIPDANGCIVQYVGVVTRHRKRPESFPTVVELYSMLSMAAMFRKQKTHAGVVRLFIVHSCWVQVLSATAPLSYIMSILEGRDSIEGILEIIESPWFNLLSLPSLEQLLLYAFESATLTEHERIPEMFLNRTVQSGALKRVQARSDLMSAIGRDSAGETSAAVTKISDYEVEHRDVRPPNVLWNPEIRNVVLVDFERSEILEQLAVLQETSPNRKQKHLYDPRASRRSL
ncbi:hypothetical protein G7Y89_g9718 [Cudoniella acicularis]|uniref:Protein kinase domain-containing protein n=1 Tax=Cudoniella acicularis TaxID=354080 RepID=A0A8H4VZV2_9HELO|nr:hypothetical protein G7Y89_g9718 [Cudoniella acicularis]